MGLPCGYSVGGGGGGYAGARITGAGDIVYRNSGAGGLDYRRVVADSFTRYVNGGTLYPADPLSNDPIVVAPSCPTPSSNGEVYDWRVQGGTGALIYACVSSTNIGFDWYDSNGAVKVASVHSVYAWTSGDSLLVSDDGIALKIVSPSGVSTPVTGFSAPTGQTPADWLYRTHGDAFWVVTPVGPDGAQLWSIDSVGVATLVGTYADSPSTMLGGGAVIDGTGVLYQLAVDTTSSSNVVMKRPLGPDVATVVYSEANMPVGANDFSVYPLNAYNRINTLDTAELITEP